MVSDFRFLYFRHETGIPFGSMESPSILTHCHYKALKNFHHHPITVLSHFYNYQCELVCNLILLTVVEGSAFFVINRIVL